MRFLLPLLLLASLAHAQEAKCKATPGGSWHNGHCRIDGVLDERKGKDGKTYGIRYALALPENWNGRFLMQGGGGLNGTVHPPTGGPASGDQNALQRGFAVVSTDSGHAGAVFDGSFMADQQAALDFAYVAIGRVAALAKKLTQDYYGQAPKYSYFAGCSTGGREAMVMTQRYPSLFDGVIAGAPAMRTGYSNLADRYVATLLNKVAPRDAAGKPQAALALSASDKKVLMDALMAHCDAKDGARDGQIFNVTGCDFDPRTVQCKGDKQEGCLSAGQVEAIRLGLAGPKTSRGVAVYSGFAWDTGLTASGAGSIPGLLNPGPSPVGPPNTATEMDVDAAADVVARDEMAKLTDSTWTNLSGFSGHGGKLLFFHGVSDPWFSALDTAAYYDRMAAANGGPATVLNWSRLYLVPGMGHCGGGAATLDRFDLLSPLMAWVEQGAEPAPVATGRSLPGRSRPMCAYPKYPHYKGQGDVEKAENWECRVPAPR